MFDVLVGKHGDHIGGERDAVRALLARRRRRGVHPRRQPPRVRARRHASRPGAQDPRADARRTITATSRSSTMRRPEPVARFRELLLGDVVRRCRGPSAARPRRPEGVAARARQRLRAARRGRRSFGTIDAFVSDVQAAMQVDLEIARRSTRAATCWSSAPARLAPARRRSSSRGTAPGLEVDLRAWCRAKGIVSSGRRRPATTAAAP